MRGQKVIFFRVLLMIFWNITTYKYRSDLTQVIRNLISSIANCCKSCLTSSPMILNESNLEILEKPKVWVESLVYLPKIKL